MGAIADDVGADGHPGAFFLTSPRLSSVQKFCTGAEAALAVGNDQAVYFGAKGDFEERRDADMNPSDDVSFEFRYEDGVRAWRFDAGETMPHFFCGSWVAKFAAELGESRHIRGSGGPDFHGLNFETHGLRPFPPQS